MMQKVKVCFTDSSKDYVTSVSERATFNSCCSYFIGQQINLGQVQDDLHTCIGIIFYGHASTKQCGLVNL